MRLLSDCRHPHGRLARKHPGARSSSHFGEVLVPRGKVLVIHWERYNESTSDLPLRGWA